MITGSALPANLHSVASEIDNGLMTIFFLAIGFLAIGLEIGREVAKGSLSDRRNALLPVLAAFGGMAGAALIYLEVISMCGKVAHAVRAVDAGCDLVVAQGTEAGGRTAQVASFPLIPQIVDAVGRCVPVVGAAGIFNGNGNGNGRRRGSGLAGALTLGTDGIWVGTCHTGGPRRARHPPGRRLLHRWSRRGEGVLPRRSGCRCDHRARPRR